MLLATAVLAGSYRLAHISVAKRLGEASNNSVATSHFVIILVACVVSLGELRCCITCGLAICQLVGIAGGIAYVLSMRRLEKKYVE